MKKSLIALILGVPLILGACTKPEEPAVSDNAVSEDAAATPAPPTATPTPTPIPLPENYVTVPEEWVQIPPEGEGWIAPDWLDDHVSIIEWNSNQGGTIISSITEAAPDEAANKIIANYENAVAANVYATAGDCTVETAFFGNAIGFFIAPKWSEKTYCCFVVGNISSGVGWDLTTKALANYEQFSKYDYNLSKLLNTRICIEGNIRAIDSSYWEKLEKQANELSGWILEDNEGYRDNVQGIYKLITSLDTAVDVTDLRQGQSETVYTPEDGIRVCDIHLPDGFDSLEPYNNNSTKERYVSIVSKDYSLIVEGRIAPEYADCLYDLIWNERDIVFWDEEAEEDPALTTEDGEEGEGSEEESTEETPADDSEASAEDKDEESTPIRLLDLFACGEGNVYMFAEVPDGTPADATYSETEVSGYTFVYYREDGIGCTLYVSAKLYDTKKKALDLAKQIFL